MSRIVDYLEHIEEFYNKGSETIKWNDLSEFERSYKYNFKLEQIKARLSYLHKWNLSIGKEVYLSRDSWDYTLTDNFSSLDVLIKKNFDNSFSNTFTKEYYDRLCLDYITYSIDYLMKYLLERELTSNSTCKLRNLIFEWELQCKQDLIKDFQNSLKY